MAAGAGLGLIAGAAVGASTGVIGGATGVAIGAAAGAGLGLIIGLAGGAYRPLEPDPPYADAVVRCLIEQGYEVTGGTNSIRCVRRGVRGLMAGPTLVRRGIGNHTIHFPSFVTFREIFRDRHSVFPDKQ